MEHNEKPIVCERNFFYQFISYYFLEIEGFHLEFKKIMDNFDLDLGEILDESDI